MRKIAQLYITFLVLCTGTVLAQTSFNVEADTNRILIGGQIMLELQAQIPADKEIVWPPLQDSLAEFEIIRKSTLEEELSGDLKILTQRVWVTTFDTGYAFIPALNTQVGEQRLQSQAIGILVGMPQVEPNDEYFDIKEPIDPPLNWLLIIVIALGLVALGVAVYWLITRLQKRKPGQIPAPEAAMSPYDWAKAQVERLREEKLWQQGQIKQYYSEVTQVLRQYIEREMYQPAMESTADEVTEIIRGLRPQQGLMEECEKLMALSVGVKYAKLTPTDADHYRALATLEKFLEAYKPKEEKTEDVSVSV